MTHDFSYFSTFSGIGGFEAALGAVVSQGPVCRVFGDRQIRATRLPAALSRPPQLQRHPTHRHRWHYRTLISSLAAFPARLFLSPEGGAASTTSEVRSSLRSLGCSSKSNHAFYCLKTSKGFYLTGVGARSLPSPQRLMSWGTTCNGRCLTARISASPSPASACSLSDILEERPDRKYFRSQACLEGHLRRRYRSTLETVFDPSGLCATLRAQGERYSDCHSIRRLDTA